MNELKPLNEWTYRDIALQGAEWLNRMSSADGSGHADLGRRMEEMVAQADTRHSQEPDEKQQRLDRIAELVEKAKREPIYQDGYLYVSQEDLKEIQKLAGGGIESAFK